MSSLTPSSLYLSHALSLGLPLSDILFLPQVPAADEPPQPGCVQMYPVPVTVQ